MATRVVFGRFVGALAVTLGLLASEAEASPTRAWQDGNIAWTSHNECITGAVEYLTGTYVGYVGNSDVTFPRVGDVYYSHVVVSTVGNPCAGPYIHVEVALPKNTTFQISPGNRVYCFYTNPQGQTSQIINECPQTVSASPYNNGYFVLNSTAGPWPLARGAFLEIQFPVRSMVPLSGIATNDYLWSATASIAASTYWANPKQGVFVGAKPPGSRLGQGGYDWDYDLRSDLAVYNPPSGLWYVRRSTNGTTYNVGYGGTGYTPVPGDYDWDGYADIAVYHSSSGLWFVKPSSAPSTTFTLAFGGSAYTPVPADYDWDGRVDFAVYHQPSGLWYIQQSTTLTTVSVNLGGPGFEPVQRDFDGDGKTDVAVYNPTTAQWLIRQSSTGTNLSLTFGGSGYVPVPRDYDGDGKADVAAYHPATGLWYIRQSSTGTTINVGFGSSAYTPVPADYDGDGKADISVYHQPSGLWFIKQSFSGTTATISYGGSGFPPVN
jgi:hypothetical protein